MFTIITTKPLNDHTKGFRFNLLGIKGLTRKRKTKSNGYRIKVGDCMIAVHVAKRSIYFETRDNRFSKRAFGFFTR